MTPRLYVVVDWNEAQVSVPYNFKDVVKRVHGYRWDDDSKSWIFNSWQADDVASALRSAGCQVTVVEANHVCPRPVVVPQRNWAEVLLNRLDPDMGERVFRALSRVLHPDVGGDPTLQRELNDARRPTSARWS